MELTLTLADTSMTQNGFLVLAVENGGVVC
jgi:hypothetical protein